MAHPPEHWAVTAIHRDGRRVTLNHLSEASARDQFRQRPWLDEARFLSVIRAELVYWPADPESPSVLLAFEDYDIGPAEPGEGH